jgi:hypothetical protein
MVMMMMMSTSLVEEKEYEYEYEYSSTEIRCTCLLPLTVRYRALQSIRRQRKGNRLLCLLEDICGHTYGCQDDKRCIVWHIPKFSKKSRMNQSSKVIFSNGMSIQDSSGWRVSLLFRRISSPLPPPEQGPFCARTRKCLLRGPSQL